MRHRNLVLGDIWTTILDSPMLLDKAPAQVGDEFSKWFDTAEPGRVFRILRITERDGTFAYESQFIGFAIVRKNEDGTLDVTLEESIPTE